uniref:BEN domain containing 7 n=1 Tax=Maylandia zebra TaxID=106582 RepID=A0A3P9CW24_9CICH
MEFGERKRRRKSQSFKLVTDGGKLLNECKTLQDARLCLGDEGMEIKRQITGMMRLLSDKTSRVYQRAGTEQDSLTKEPQEKPLNWINQPELLSLDPGPGCGQYSTRSRALRILNSTKGLIKVNETNETPCCMCNCKGTLQAILQELRGMRRLMQNQKASLEKQERAASPSQPRLGAGPSPRHRPRKRRPIYRMAPLSVFSTRRAGLAPLDASLLKAAPVESVKKRECEKQDSSTTNNHPISSDIPSEVRLAEDYDVFISKAQLDSILVNYTRSGSLLFRKLVCAFFDDATLANSLPNGKRKRGLNDNRKGLDQNIVGAIKVFTEKYCTEHKIEKLPGPRDWVQILQDQIKLARRRLKRGSAAKSFKPF